MPLIIPSPYSIDQSHRPAWNINRFIYSTQAVEEQGGPPPARARAWTDMCKSTIITSKQTTASPCEGDARGPLRPVASGMKDWGRRRAASHPTTPPLSQSHGR